MSIYCPALFFLVFCVFCRAETDLPSVQRNIKKKIREEAKNREGAYYRETLKNRDYQDSADLARARGRLKFERSRDAEAERLMKNGPIVLNDLLTLSLEFNSEVLATRAHLRAVQGEGLINFSRFLPHVDFLLHSQRVDSGFAGASKVEDRSIRVTQTFLEFGAENDTGVALRQSRREALFSYEEAVARTLQNVRIRFYTILLWQEQIQERQVLLDEYRTRYENMRELEKVRRVLEVDVLTSRLNVLHEEARINALEKELYRQKVDLLRYAGFPVHLTDFTLKGGMVPFGLEMEKCVDLALRRSTAVAQSRAGMDEHGRLARRSLWAFGPDLKLDLTWLKDKNGAGVTVGQSNGTTTVSGFAEQYLKGPEGILLPNEFLKPGDEGWTVDFQATMPLFQGFYAWGKRKKEKALLEQSSFELRATMDSVEISVRKAFQNMLEQQKELDILKETAEISRERLKIQESLKELGKITDNELETFRNRFFEDQGAYYGAEIALIVTQEELRYEMRWFETDTANESDAK